MVLENLSGGTYSVLDRPLEIASDERLCKLHEYARFCRFFLGMELDEAVDLLKAICENTSLKDLEHDCERIARLAFQVDEPVR